MADVHAGRQGRLLVSDSSAALWGALPKRVPWTVERSVNLAGGVASLLGIAFLFVKFDDLGSDGRMIVALTYLFSIIMFLVAYIVIVSHRKLHRYAQAVFHLHFVNHVVRDHVAAVYRKDQVSLRDDVQKILDSIAHCYSILTGRVCRVALKEITQELDVVTAGRDSMARTSSRDGDPAAGKNSFSHSLDGNTDFSHIWYMLDGCERYYLSNDLPQEWKHHRYNNTSFFIRGKPETSSIFGITFIKRWTLPYKSALVLPIRCISAPRKLQSSAPPSGPEQNPQRVWGFLCVDTASRGAFRLPHAAELGGAFADALYILFTFSSEVGGGSREELKQ